MRVIGLYLYGNNLTENAMSTEMKQGSNKVAPQSKKVGGTTESADRPSASQAEVTKPGTNKPAK